MPYDQAIALIITAFVTGLILGMGIIIFLTVVS